MSEAGAGQIGDYSGCHWQVAGTGSFRPEAGANPTIGAVGKTEFVSEHRLEMIAPASRRAAVVRAMRQAHPYEEPAFDVLNLAQLPADRKSTRLNSSHVAISYAVFCLKNNRSV